MRRLDETLLAHPCWSAAGKLGRDGGPRRAEASGTRLEEKFAQQGFNDAGPLSRRRKKKFAHGQQRRTVSSPISPVSATSVQFRGGEGGGGHVATEVERAPPGAAASCPPRQAQVGATLRSVAASASLAEPQSSGEGPRAEPAPDLAGRSPPLAPRPSCFTDYCSGGSVVRLPGLLCKRGACGLSVPINFRRAAISAGSRLIP